MTVDRRLINADNLAHIANLVANRSTVTTITAGSLIDHIAAQSDQIADLTLRLSIATETNVADRKRLAELEAGLTEALNNWEGVAHFDHDTIIRLRDLLPLEET